jgi:hypothetical protein
MLRKILLVFVIAFVAVCLVSGCSLTPNRHVYLKYSFFVEPLKDEQIKNFVLYLPFPNHGGRILQKAFKETEQRYVKYGEGMDRATWDVVSTKYGPMLKLSASELKEGVGSGCEIGVRQKMEIKEYYLWQDTGNHRHPYLYKPRFEIKMRGKQRYAHTMIYSEGEDGSGFSLEMRYDISDRAPSPFPFIFGHEWGGDFLAFFGIEQPPDPIPGSAGVPIEITEFGWNKIPVAECE